jgi:hypothetical protein
MVFAMIVLGCASAPTAPSAGGQSEVTLAPGGSTRPPGTNLTVVFEEIVEDSRCPTGVECVWEGDAAAGIRIETPNAAPSTYTLHTSDRFPRQIEHGPLRVRLVSVSPYPAADTTIEPDQYRITLAFERR